MSENNIQCPSCGGPVQNPEGKDKISCCYCGQSFVAEEVNEGTSKIKPKNEKMYNYLIMADTAKSGGDNKEAILYYNKVLEEDPTYSAAWYGKGISVANTGTVGKPKISEATAAFKNAVLNAKDKKATKKTVAITLAHTVHITHDSIRDHAEEFGDFIKNEPVIEYMHKFASYAEALNYAFELHPTEEIADLVIDEIYKFSTTKYMVIVKDLDKMCNGWAKKCIDFKKKADKEYEAPNWSEKENSGRGASTKTSTKWESKGPKSKVVAGTLGILLGLFGAHKFYLGYNKQGAIMLVLSILFYPVMILIGLIEGIMYLLKSEEDFTSTYVDNKKGWF